jgi:nitroimidazol reductase NimA-like FMN-containing flavoprotein (pyridoxamine 5'-phosphate oxidase superfamily)
MLIHEMTETECLSTLAHTRLGRLACAHENQPYVVPIYFVYEQPYLYGFTTLGQKVEWMRSNPLVCVELDEVVDSDRWMSIVILGRYEEQADTREQEPIEAREPWHGTARPTWREHEPLHAHELLQEHAGWWEPGCASCTHRNPKQPVAPIFYRIRIDRISGRQATPNPVGSVGARMSPRARDRQGWLRKVIYALSKPFASRKAMEKYE